MPSTGAEGAAFTLISHGFYKFNFIFAHMDTLASDYKEVEDLQAAPSS
jgi:hypothetical protein